MDRNPVVRVFLGLFVAGCLAGPSSAPARERGPFTALMPKPELRLPHPEVKKRLARYVPAEIGVPPGKADPKTQKLLKKLVLASEAIDRVYWDQVSEEGSRQMGDLSQSADQESKDTAALLRINYGPWDRFADNEPLIGRQPRPEGVNLYPQDFSRRELEQWLTEHPEDREAFTSPYTVIRREGAGLVAIPYSRAYRVSLDQAATALRDAANLTDCKPFAKFLAARADAFASNDYYKSDLLWMDSNCPVDIAVGPYEFYEDRLMGYKTTFQALVTMVDADQTAQFASLDKYTHDLLANLPLADELRSRVELAKPAPITIANEVFAAGDAKAGFQIRAFVLPNDERVVVAKGTKHVILKNVVDARFHKLLEPVAAQVLVPEQAAQVSDEAYLDILLMWQMAHGFSPRPIVLSGGGNVSPRILLRQRYGVIEAARSEAVAILNALYLVDQKVFAPTMANTIPITHLASLFESFRYGTMDTHGLAKLMVYNYLAANGAYRYEPATKKFWVNYDRLPNALRNLVSELLTIEINGDYDRAGQDVFDFGIVPGEVRAKLAEMRGLPIDILPTYTVSETVAK